jgi:hypothetical protein
MVRLDSEYAQAEAVAPPFCGRILDGKVAARLRRINTLGAVLICGGVGIILLGAGVWCIAENNSLKSALADAFFVVGSSLIVAVFVVAAFLGFCQNLWLRRIARSEIRRRPGRLVDPDARNVLFVEIVPVSNWSENFSDETATDVGLLQIDMANGQLLFEGEYMRYQIPSGAIARCEQDYYTRLDAETLRYFHFVIVTIKLSAEKTVEIPFRIRRNYYGKSDQRARDTNFDFFTQIGRLRKSTESVQSDRRN